MAFQFVFTGFRHRATPFGKREGGALSDAPSTPSIGLDACARMVEASAKACSAPVVQRASAPEPNWDAMATSLSGLSTALAYGSVLLGLLALITAVGWGYLITRKAEKEAREEAEKCARNLIEKWLTEEAPSIIRRRVEMLQDASLGRTDDDQAADEIGRVAG